MRHNVGLANNNGPVSFCIEEELRSGEEIVDKEKPRGAPRRKGPLHRLCPPVQTSCVPMQG